MKRLTLAGNTTVITGAASGMGAEVARQLSAAGAHVALLDRNGPGLAAVAADLPGIVTTHVVDVSDDEAVERTIADVIDAHPSINALVTCAGSSMLGTLEQLTMEEMRWLMDSNLWGTVSVTKHLLPALRRAPGAHVTHLASVYGLAAPGGRIPYSMTKFAVRAFSDALRHELEDTTVTVGTVFPAGVRTGIILHGRYAATIDPAVAARAASAQAALYSTDPADAAAAIIRATARRRKRTLVGTEARLIDLVTRIAPTGYWTAMRSTLRQATDTTTPA
ncbi:SDR family NAD(P)-dependent oxidoreductase [uncultured Microbacterium sp.]|uniref:SDR family NAD(P)-dependent oxidoreductase n=1 Tax=uncultured Microbacterium sp. TaxID=191216 RepID=UPI00261F21DA|nr:SDR family NAD(P)-dependent oxidoreductase [uncultured Microbacterium sp.]